MQNKVFSSAQEALADLPAGARIMIGGFGVPQAWPSTLLMTLRDLGTANLTVIANFLGFGPTSPQILSENKQIKHLIACFGGLAGIPTAMEEQIRAGEVTFEPVPQGILTERMRAGGAGIPAFYSPTGVGTPVAEGKEKRTIDGREYILETALKADYAFIRARKADRFGNLVYRGGSRNFNPIMATAATVTIVEVEEIVEVGELDPEEIITPGIYVDRIVQSTLDRASVMEMVRSVLKARFGGGENAAAPTGRKPGLSREMMALRVANELQDGEFVNLGIGIPTLIGNFIMDREITLHAENGILNYGSIVEEGQEDADFYNAGGQFVSLRPGAAFFSSLEAFGMARGGHVNTVVLGGFQVAENGDLANWWAPKMGAGGIGGAMDLAVGGARLIVVMEHVTNDGQPRILKQCTYPLTAQRCVSLIVTDLAVIEVTRGGLVLKEVAFGWTPEEVQALTEAKLIVSPDCREMSL